MNWDDTRIFLAIRREGTLRGASRRLGIDQATVGRRLAGLERALDAKLFLRGSDGLTLTEAGDRLVVAAERMERGADEIERQVLGSDARLQGSVRVTTTDTLGLGFVIPAMGRLRQKYPAISVALSTSTDILNLVRREADIAIRTVAPESPDLLARRMTSWPMGLYASRDYVARRGEPVFGSAFADHDLVLYQPHLTTDRHLTLVGEAITASRVVATATSSLMVRTMIGAGLGIGEVPVPLAERDRLVRIWPDRIRSEPYDIWLVTHRDLRHTARISVVIEEIVSSFSREDGG